MNFGNMFSELAGTAEPVPGWVQVAVWPVLIMVAIFAGPKGG